nr:efflux transporter outer membrane subunit [Geomonas sp. Red32]
MLAALVLVLSGCAVGPDFHRPPAPTVSTFTGQPLPATTASAPVPQGGEQKIVSGREIPAEWWTLFRNQPLNDLIALAVKNSPNLAAAQAALREAEENRRAQFGTLLPTADANFAVQRQKFSSAAFGQPNAPSSTFTLYNASVQVSYNLDLAGGERRALEASQAQLDYQRYLLEGSHLTLSSNLVTTAVQQASLKARIREVGAMIAAQDEEVRLMERRLELGAGTRPELLAQQAQLAQTKTSLPPLEKELAQSRHQMAVLAGRFPSESGALPEFDLAGLQLPQELPLSLPSELVRQRPDVLAAEEILHQASAQVGVAESNLFPKITLSGSFGPQSTTFADLFTSGSVWSIGAGIVQPLFHGGELRARKRAAEAAYEQAAAQYRATVLQAFQNVADVLRALELDAKALRAQSDAEQAAKASFDLTRKQYDAGAVNYLLLLDAERLYLQARITLAQAQAARLADSAALFQALGGGWWNRTAGNAPPSSPPPSP